MHPWSGRKLYPLLSVVVAAMLLAFALQAHKRFGTLDPRELRSMRE